MRWPDMVMERNVAVNIIKGRTVVSPATVRSFGEEE